MEDKIQELKTRLAEASDLGSIGAVLHWDQSTGMPRGGGPARARQMSLLGRLGHEAATDPAIGRLLDEVQPYAETLPYDDDTAALVRVARTAGSPKDKGAGLLLNKKVGNKVDKGETLFTIYSEHEWKLQEALKLAVRLEPIKTQGMVLARVPAFSRVAL